MKRAGELLRSYWIPIIAVFGLVGYGALRVIQDDPTSWTLLLVILVGGLPLLWETVRSMFRGRFNVDLIAVVSIFGGLVVDQYLPAAIIVLMMSGGEALETFALRRASGALGALMKRVPRTANRWNGHEYLAVSVEQVAAGDRLLIKPGDAVPVDAEIVEGSSEVDESLLTGESVPVLREVGERLLSGSINLNSPLTATAVTPADQSTFAQIMQLVQEAQAKRADIQQMADRFGAWFTPITFIFVATTIVLTRSPLLGYAVLVIATPCPLILATPVAIIAGIGRAARLGIIVKSGSALEGLARSRTVLFDKTGTLTTGQLILQNISLFGSGGQDEVLRLTAALEQYSNHVIALSLVRVVKRTGQDIPRATEIEEIPGRGLSGRVGGSSVLVGNRRCLEERGIALEDADRIQKPGEILLYVANDGEHIATLLLKDSVRMESATVVRTLKSVGFGEIVMLTGDRQEVAAQIANQVGIDDVRAGLLPEDKLRVVEAVVAHERRSGHTVIMVGDGINDAPALERADVGVAIGKQGGEVAVEAADVVLLGDQLERLTDSIRIGRAVMRIAGQGIWFGMLASIAGMFAAAFGYLPPVAGAVAQEGIDVLVVLNALRVVRV